jgi:Arc/MetJ-type ribon-helix-helix transcriptional regulator
MTIHLPKDLETSVRAEVRSGHFANEDELVAEAVRSFLQQQPTPAKKPLTAAEFDQHLLDIGLMSQLPDTDADFDDPDDQLIDIKGEPLSETIIRERG